MRILTNRKFEDGRSWEAIDKTEHGFFWHGEDFTYPVNTWYSVSFSFPVEQWFVEEKFIQMGRVFDATR